MASAVSQTPPTTGAPVPPQPDDPIIRVMAWIEVHRSKLVAGLAAFIAICGVVFVWRHFQREREAKANLALLELRARPGQPESAPKPADFLKVADKHATTSVGPRARLMAAAAYFADNKYAEAQVEFEKVLAQSGSGPIAAQAAFGVAVCLDALDKVDAASAKYQDVIARFADDSVAEARLALARLEDARKQPEAAVRLYDEVLRDEREVLLARWRRRPGEIQRRNPQMAATNAPAVPLK